MSSQGRPRLLVLTTTLPAAEGDGTPSFVADLARCLAETFDQVVLAPRVPITHPGPVTGDPPFRVVRFPYFIKKIEGLARDAIMPTIRRSPWRIIEAPFLVYQMLRWAKSLATTGEFSAVVAHWSFPGGWVAQRLYRRFGIPYTVTLHGADVFVLRGRLFQRMRSRVLADAAAVLPVSQDIASVLDGDNSLHIIPMGALVSELPEIASRSRDRFLFVGRLADKKGVDIAIRALARLDRGSLLVIGSGPEEASLRLLAEQLGIADRVGFAGKRSKAQVLEALQEAAALLIPSRVGRDGDKEGTPVVLAEAAATGTPVIASKLAGLSEQIRAGETGFLVAPEDVDGLVSAMLDVLDHPERARSMGRRARSEFQAGPLNMATTANRYAEILLKVIRDRS